MEEEIVFLLKNPNEPESVRVRPVEAKGKITSGELLEEPKQNFGYHKGDLVGYFLFVDDKNTSVYICDLNPGRKMMREDMEGGLLLNAALHAFRVENTQDKFAEIFYLLRDSFLWIPCRTVLSGNDKNGISEMIVNAGDSHESLKGMNYVLKDAVRLAPDILRRGDDFFFPTFSSIDAMGEYKKQFAKMEWGFFDVVTLAKRDERVSGIVVNAFTDPFILDWKMCEVVGKMESRIR